MSASLDSHSRVFLIVARRTLVRESGSAEALATSNLKTASVICPSSESSSSAPGKWSDSIPSAYREQVRKKGTPRPIPRTLEIGWLVSEALEQVAWCC